MRYFLDIFLPPVAMLTCGRIFSAAVRLVLMLTLVGWLPAAIWAGFVVTNHHAEKRQEKLQRPMHRGV